MAGKGRTGMSVSDFGTLFEQMVDGSLVGADRKLNEMDMKIIEQLMVPLSKERMKFVERLILRTWTEELPGAPCVAFYDDEPLDVVLFPLTIEAIIKLYTAILLEWDVQVRRCEECGKLFISLHDLNVCGREHSVGGKTVQLSFSSAV